MDPGPINKSLLTLQEYHRSTAIWEGEEMGELACRSHLKSGSHFQPDLRVLHFLRGTQFWGIHRLCFVPLDTGLITALVERWRQETHTFHLPFGEVSILLQDVNVLLGLRVTGRPVTGCIGLTWATLAENILGIRPHGEDIRGGSVKLTWLFQNFQVLPPNASEAQIAQFIRAYILYMLGTVLFADKSGNRVHLMYLPLIEDLTQVDSYSWGSASLAWLYRNMCRASTRLPTSEKWPKQIGGVLILLQLWAWERITFGRPVLHEQLHHLQPLGQQFDHGVDPLGCRWLRVERSYLDHRVSLVQYRDAFDRMEECQFTWQPYREDILSQLRPSCTENRDEWRVIAPTHHFEAVEWHLPQRCLRQFGWNQPIPKRKDTDMNLHNIERRGWIDDFHLHHIALVQRWTERMNKVVQDTGIYQGLMHPRDPYMKWYKKRTRLIISPNSARVNEDFAEHHYYHPTGADYEELTRMGVYTYNSATTMLGQCNDDTPCNWERMLHGMQSMALTSLQNSRQAHLLDIKASVVTQQEEDEQEEGEQEEGEHDEEEDDGPTSQSPPRYDLRQLASRTTRNMEDGESSTRTKRGRGNRG